MTAHLLHERTVLAMPPSSVTTLVDRARSLALGYTPLDQPQEPVAIPRRVGDLLCVETLRALTNQRSWDRGLGLLTDQPAQARSGLVSGSTSASSVRGVVSGSGSRTYEVTLRQEKLKTRDRDVLVAECTCPANAAPRGCKHVVLFGLLLLGYEPDDTTSRLAPVPPPPLPATPSLRSLLDELPGTVVRNLLAEVAASHSDVHDLVLDACPAAAVALPAQNWAAAVEKQVQRALSELDWGREWKYAGGRAAAALTTFYDQSCRLNANEHTTIALAVLRGALSVATGDVGDRYGDCEALALRLLTDLANVDAAGGLTDAAREDVADVVCLLAGAEVGYGDLKSESSRQLISLLLGDRGSARLADRSAAAQRTVARLTEASATSRGAVAATRERQLDDAWRAAAAIEELRSRLSFA